MSQTESLDVSRMEYLKTIGIIGGNISQNIDN